MIEGLRPPDAGTIMVAGYDTRTQTEDVRPAIGVQRQSTALFDYLTASELIALFADLYGVDSSEARIDHLLGMVGLRENAIRPPTSSPVASSNGSRSRLGWSMIWRRSFSTSRPPGSTPALAASCGKPCGMCATKARPWC